MLLSPDCSLVGTNRGLGMRLHIGMTILFSMKPSVIVIHKISLTRPLAALIYCILMAQLILSQFCIMFYFTSSDKKNDFASVALSFGM